MIPFAMQIDTIRQRTLEAFHRYMDTILAALPGLVGALSYFLSAMVSQPCCAGSR